MATQHNIILPLEQILQAFLMMVGAMKSFFWITLDTCLGYIAYLIYLAPFCLACGTTASKQSGLKFSMTPYLSPRLTPTATPKIVSASVSPGRYSAAGSPQKTSGVTSPTKSQYEMRGSLSSWYPSSQQSSAANSPPRGRPMPGLLNSGY